MKKIVSFSQRARIFFFFFLFLKKTNFHEHRAEKKKGWIAWLLSSWVNVNFYVPEDGSKWQFFFFLLDAFKRETFSHDDREIKNLLNCAKIQWNIARYEVKIRCTMKISHSHIIIMSHPFVLKVTPELSNPGKILYLYPICTYKWFLFL